MGIVQQADCMHFWLNFIHKSIYMILHIYGVQRLEICRTTGDRLTESCTLCNLGNCLRATGKLEEAIDHYTLVRPVCASCPPAMILHTHIELGAQPCHWVQAWWDCVPTQSWYYLWAAGATRQGYRVAHIGKSIYTDLMRSTTLIVFFPCLSAASQCSRRERGLAWTGQSS